MQVCVCVCVCECICMCVCVCACASRTMMHGMPTDKITNVLCTLDIYISP